MKIYLTDKEFEEILLKFGFIETTNKRDQIRGKKEFRLNKYAQKKIYFDYTNIQIIKSNHRYSCKTSISVNDAVHILLYFTLRPHEKKELFDNDICDLKKVTEYFDILKMEYLDLKTFNSHERKRNKLKHIIDVYEELTHRILNLELSNV